jgi:hypothetical protein
MPADDAALERLRDDLLVAIRTAVGDSERRVLAAVAASEARLEARLVARLEGRIDASAAETRRHMGVLAEDLTSKIAIVAEGVVTLTERLGAEMRGGFEIIDRRLLRVETRPLSAPER